MSRAWDTWNSYLNNDGKLIHGKIRFCKKGTTDNIAIYNRDGVAIRNPEFTDMLGRTEYQVFVDNVENVTAYFYEYIGTGDMMQWPGEDYDPTRWAYQYSSDNMDPVNTVNIESTGADGVATMSDLRDKDPDEVPTVNGAKLLWLYGYYAAGDTSPVLYVWDSASLASDDGGSVIMPDSVSGPGRWILASQEYIFDVRHFGIFPQNSKYSVDFSYTSQLSNCATYLVNKGMNAWFPDYPDAIGYYLMDGSNTFSIDGDIYVSDAVRFICKTDTTGTAIQCHELHKAAPYLFDSTVQTGTATLTCDNIKISWVGGYCTGNARIGWVIDTDDFARTITGKEVKFIHNGNSALQLDNCQIVSHKQITGDIAISNSLLKTDYFADDYDWTKLSSSGNTILLDNCKDADTYILLKNKQGEADYGDLGEQRIDADILAGGNIENCYGTATLVSHGATEMHNVSLAISGLNSSDTLNLVDAWISLAADTVVGSVQLRRGSIGGNVELQVLADSLIDDGNIEVDLKSLGAKLTVRNSSLYGTVTGQDVVLTNNQIYAEVDQTDVDGVIHVMCTGNMFHMANNVPARHYIHAATADSVVQGIWAKNGSSYDTVHWIRLDRTNLKAEDWEHAYTYVGNSEPYLMKWNGRNHPMSFATFKGYREDGTSGADVFEQFTGPFCFLNTLDRQITVVPRNVYWKMFTVGSLHPMRSGHLMCGRYDGWPVGNAAGQTDNGQVVPTWYWGCTADPSVPTPSVYGGDRYGAMWCICRDGAGEADYVYSFEPADEYHYDWDGEHPTYDYHYGPYIGNYPSNDFTGSTLWGTYPSTPSKPLVLFVMIDPDFSVGTNPMGWNPS